VISARRAYLAVVAVAIGAAALAALRPDWGGWAAQTADLPYLTAGVATTIAVAVGAHRARGAARLVWTLLAVGIGLTASADIGFVIVTARDPSLVVSPLDVVYLASYLFLGAGLWVLARARSRSTAARAALDGLALAVGLGLLVWETVLVAPGSLTESASWIQSFVLVAYPVLDLFLLAGVATVLLSSRRREPALWGLLAFVSIFLASDLAFSVVSASSDAVARWADVGFAVSFLAMGLAALDPSAVRVADPVAPEPAGFGRFLVLGLSMAAPGVTAAFAISITGGVNTAVLVTTTTLIAAVLTLRVASTMRAETDAREVAEDARARLSTQMRVDALTGLPNRTALMERLEEAFAHRPPALLFVDLDRFKVVNDTAGHTMGDLVLCQSAERILTSVGADDEVFRLSGDEFIVLCPEARDAAEAEATAASIVEAFGPPFTIGSLEWFVGASVGVAVGAEGDGSDPDRLLRDADLAMYEAKRDGRRSVRLFDTRMRERLQRRHELEISLRHAVEQGEIEPAFQAVVSLADRRIVGFEALARWRRGTGLEVPASQFIDAAEEAGMIAKIDAFMLERACHFIRSWNEQRPDRAPAWLSVNLAAEDLAAADLTTRVQRALAATGIEPGWLLFELTEGALALDPDLAVRRLSTLRDLGVGLAIDDFGTGAASLAQLLRFPVDLLKVDRVFVDSLSREGSSRSIAAAALRVAGTLGIPAVAQGVETAEQAELLAELGYPLAQGFFFARPMSAADAARLQMAGGDTEGAPLTPTTVR
jgi:diguanylate cyclase (GGDEF)-like protein